MMRAMMNLWSQVTLLLVLVSVLSSRPKCRLSKATAVNRVLRKGAFSKGRRSSLIVKAATLSTHDLVLLQVTELSNSRQNEDKNEVHDVAEQGSDIFGYGS